MVSFYACENRYTKIENSKEILDEAVQTFNELFKHRSCAHHPELDWHIGVDFLPDGRFHLHDTTKSYSWGLCTFGIDLFNVEIVPLLARPPRLNPPFR
jgi:hypothetical protein